MTNQCLASVTIMSAISGVVGNLYNIDCVLPANIFHHSPVSGLQSAQSLYSCPGASQVHIWGLLEDDLGAEHWNHHHDHQPGGKRQSRFTGIIRKNTNGKRSLTEMTDFSDVVNDSLCLLCPSRGNVTSTGRWRTVSSMETLWWRWKAPKCTPATHCGVFI